MSKKFILIAALLLILTGCSSGNKVGSKENEDADAEEGLITLRLAHVASENSVYHIPAVHFAELVKEKTDGSVEIDIYPGAQLGGERDMLENLQMGSLDMGWVSMGIFDSITPVFNGFQLPFLITDDEVAYKAFTSDTGKKTLDELENFNMVGLSIINSGLRQFGSNGAAFTHPKEFKNASIRAPESDMLLESFKTLGINPTPIPYPELYSALQTGVIDGADQAIISWWSDGFYEVVDTVTMLNAYPWPAIITINKETLDKLTESQQKALVDAAHETHEYQMKILLEEMIPESVSNLEEAGVKVVKDVNPEPFREILQPVYDKYADKHPLIKETIEMVNSIEKEQ